MLPRAWLKRRPKDANKGTSGRVLIIAGSRGMVGAAVLSTMGAIRAGAGLVKLATVKSQQVVAAKRAPLEATTLGCAEDSKGQLSPAAWKDLNRAILDWRPSVIACGPGLGTGAGVKKIVSSLLAQSALPVVLDADGLNILARSALNVRCPLIITPHAGEMARLLNWSVQKVNENRELAAKTAARRFRAVCLLKGAGTLVTNGRVVWKNTTGNPAMASGGMGDVLTGIIAGLWAQNRELAMPAAALGAYLHGLAGDLALKSFPERSMTATDLVNTIPEAYKFLWRKI